MIDRFIKCIFNFLSARNGTRTRTALLPRDFKSLVSTDSTIRAGIAWQRYNFIPKWRSIQPKNSPQALNRPPKCFRSLHFPPIHPRQYTCSILCHPTLLTVFRTPPTVFRTPPIFFRKPPTVFRTPLIIFCNPPPVPCRFRVVISRAQTASTVQTVVQTFPRKIVKPPRYNAQMPPSPVKNHPTHLFLAKKKPHTLAHSQKSRNFAPDLRLVSSVGRAIHF